MTKSCLSWMLQGLEKFGKDILKYLLEEKHVDVNLRDDMNNIALHWASREGHLDVLKHLIEKGANVNEGNDSKNTAFHDAAALGRINIVKYFVQNTTIDIDIKGQNGYSPLHFAVREGHFVVVKYLISKGADINMLTTDNDRYHPLHLAAQHGHLDIVTYFIETKYVPVEQRNPPTKNTALHWAALEGKLEIVKYLISKGANVTLGNNNDNTPFHIACQKGQLYIIKYIVENTNVDINQPGDYKSTPMQFAAEKGDLEVVQYLLQKGADLKIGNAYNNTALHVAAVYGKLDVVKFLVENTKIDINIPGYRKNTPLITAAKEGHLEITKYLVQKGADFKIGDQNNNTPLDVAAQYGKLDIVKYLVGNTSVDINRPGRYKNTPLNWAAKNGRLEVVQYLLQKGADPKIGDKDNDTPLHEAARYGKLDVVKFLVENTNIDINILGINKNTPLITAVIEGHLEIIKYLVQKGADPKIGDQNNDTPLHMAARYEKLDIVKYLVENTSVDINRPGQFKNTPLHWAAINGHLEVAKYLIQKGADLNIGEQDNNTPFLEAAKFGKLNIVKYIIENTNVNLNFKNIDGKTALQLAKDGNHLDIVNYLENKGARSKRSILSHSSLTSVGTKPSSILLDSVLSLPSLVYTPYKMITSIFHEKTYEKPKGPNCVPKFSIDTCALNNVSLIYLVFQEFLDKKVVLPDFSAQINTPEEIRASALEILEDFEATLKHFDENVDDFDLLNLFSELQVHLRNETYSRVQNVLLDFVKERTSVNTEVFLTVFKNKICVKPDLMSNEP